MREHVAVRIVGRRRRTADVGDLVLLVVRACHRTAAVGRLAVLVAQAVVIPILRTAGSSRQAVLPAVQCAAIHARESIEAIVSVRFAPRCLDNAGPVQPIGIAVVAELPSFHRIVAIHPSVIDDAAKTIEAVY